ncbi:hypothetical protein OTU49_005496 [Cherax quadricarinatus]|uniref:Uncharacterized protein n=1 Tax=Cherax quadricarinatus TaxID=27406 RepID=A0AAW0YKQ5_CHEQU
MMGFLFLTKTHYSFLVPPTVVKCTIQSYKFQHLWYSRKTVSPSQERFSWLTAFRRFIKVSLFCDIHFFWARVPFLGGVVSALILSSLQGQFHRGLVRLPSGSWFQPAFWGSNSSFLLCTPSCLFMHCFAFALRIGPPHSWDMVFTSTQILYSECFVSIKCLWKHDTSNPLAVPSEVLPGLLQLCFNFGLGLTSNFRFAG